MKIHCDLFLDQSQSHFDLIIDIKSIPTNLSGKLFSNRFSNKIGNRNDFSNQLDEILLFIITSLYMYFEDFFSSTFCRLLCV